MFRCLPPILLLLAASAHAQQITIPDTIALGQPIIAEYAYAPDESTELVANWFTDERCTFASIKEPGRLKAHIWAVPGDHWVKLSLTTIKFEKRVVLVPDPQEPGNISKAKPETLRIFVSSETKEFPQKLFVVTGDAPRPPPIPPVPPEPKATALLLVLIEDVHERTPDTSIVVQSEYWVNGLKAAGHRGVKYDYRTQERLGKEHVARAGNYPLPTLIVYDAERGTQLDVTGFPSSVAALQEVVRKWTGK